MSQPASTWKNHALPRIWLEILFWVVSLVCIVTWSSFQAIRAGVAAWSLPSLQKQSVLHGGENIRLEIQRSVQKHFLDFGVYIPLEDIMFSEHISRTNPDLEAVIQRVCGNVPLALWIPLQFRMPLIGERSFEWCWKPSLKN